MLQEEIHEYYWSFRLTPDLVELRNLATVGQLIIGCAQQRRESRGLHYTIDSTERGTETYETTARRASKRETVWSTSPLSP